MKSVFKKGVMVFCALFIFSAFVFPVNAGETQQQDEKPSGQASPENNTNDKDLEKKKQELQEYLNSVLLRVNGRSLQRLVFEVAVVLTQQKMHDEKKFFNPREFPAMRQSMLEATISILLFQEEAEKAGVTVPESAVDDIIWEGQKQFPSMAEYNATVQEIGVTEEQIRSAARGLAIVKKFLDEKFNPLSVVSDEELKEYYDENPDNFIQPKMVRVRHILIKHENDSLASQYKAEKHMKQLVKRLKKGESFAKVAREESQCPSKERGGDLGYLIKGDLERARLKPVEDVVFSIEPGVMTDIIESVYGVHVAIVEDVRPSRVVPFDVIEERLRNKMQEDRKAIKIAEYARKLKADALIERLDKP